MASAQPDWLARGVAISSFLIGGGGFGIALRREWRERHRVEVDLRANRVSSPQGESEVVSVRVRTIGRPVTVENIGIAPILETIGVGIAMTAVPPGGNPPMIKHALLSDGEARTWTYHLTSFVSAEAPPGTVPTESALVRAIVTLSDRGDVKSETVLARLQTPPPEGIAVAIPPV